MSVHAVSPDLTKAGLMLRRIESPRELLSSFLEVSKETPGRPLAQQIENGRKVDLLSGLQQQFTAIVCITRKSYYPVSYRSCAATLCTVIIVLAGAAE
jgi:hypothetical protein